MGADDYYTNFEKVLVVGPIGSGKTCTIGRYVHGSRFQMNTKSTIGVDFALKDGLKRGGRTMHLQLWDIAGQERFGNMTRIYYKSASGAVVVISGKGHEGSSSLEHAQKWKEDVDKRAFLSDGSPIPCILVVNKDDLPGPPTHTDEELARFSKEHGFVGWLRASARTNTNIALAFDRLIGAILANAEQGKVSTRFEDDSSNGNVTLRDAPEGSQTKKKKKKFCGFA